MHPTETTTVPVRVAVTCGFCGKEFDGVPKRIDRGSGVLEDVTVFSSGVVCPRCTWINTRATASRWFVDDESNIIRSEQ